MGYGHTGEHESRDSKHFTSFSPTDEEVYGRGTETASEKSKRADRAYKVPYPVCNAPEEDRFTHDHATGDSASFRYRDDSLKTGQFINNLNNEYGGSCKDEGSVKKGLAEFFMYGGMVLIALALFYIGFQISNVSMALGGIYAKLDAINAEIPEMQSDIKGIGTVLTVLDADLADMSEDLSTAIGSVSDNIIMDKKYIETGRGWMGVTVTDGAAESGDKTVKGFVLVDVLPGGPADKAGLEVGDLVITINGSNVESADDFLTLIGETKPGDVLTLNIIREGWQEDKEYTVTLGNSYEAHN